MKNRTVVKIACVSILLSAGLSTKWVTLSYAQERSIIQTGTQSGVGTKEMSSFERCNKLGQEVVAARSVDYVKRAYRRFAVTCHPDKFKTPKEKQKAQEFFIYITDAYEGAIGREPAEPEEVAALDPLLIKAVKSGMVKYVKQVLDRGANINSADRNGTTALMWAVIGRHPEIVELLLTRGASPDLVNRDDYTALTYAASNGDLEIARVLVNSKADVNHVNGYGNTPLSLAIMNRHVPIVELLVEHNVDINYARRGLGGPALMLAIERGLKDIVKLLLEHGADVNLTDTFGLTPLMVAAWHGYADLVELLIHHKADVNRVDGNGKTALQMAIEEHHPVVVELLERYGAY